MDDIQGDIGSDVGQWMTYGQLAAARNIKREAAVRLVQRHGWRRQAGNDGLARVLVPPDWLKPADRQAPDDVGDVASDVTPDVLGVREAIQAAVDAVRQAKEGEIQAWRERTEASEAAREQAEKRADRAETRAHDAEKGLIAERSRADQAELTAERLEGELEAEKIARAEAEADAAELRQADAERRGQGRWDRLKAAWRGE